MKYTVIYLSALIVQAIACWWFGRGLFGFRLGALPWLIVLLMACWLVNSALVLAARRVSAAVRISAGVFVLALLVLTTFTFVENLLSRLQGMATFFLPASILSLGLVMGAFLLDSGLTHYQRWRNTGAVETWDSQARRKNAGRAAALAFVLSALLLAGLLYNLYWLTVWDTTDDSIGYIWLAFPFLAALFSAAMLVITLPGWTKLAALYSPLVMALMIAVSARAQGVDFRQLTEERAGRVTQAIETYYAREGRYPQYLRQLTPWYLLTIPGPVIIYGQGWCYQAGDDYYRLGYVNREHWSDPRLTGLVYTSTGQAPDLPPFCEAEITALRNLRPDYYLMESR